MAKSSRISKTALWVLMGLLILGLGGFGLGGFSGNVSSIGTVGDKNIPVDTYARRLQQQIRAVEQSSGEALTFARAQDIGLDRAVLQQVIRDRALDHETSQIGLSIGDETLRGRILDIDSFKGLDGSFDREAYRLALQSGGVSETGFETSLREEASRTLLEGAIVSGVTMPPAYAKTLVEYIGQKRSFTWSALDESDLDPPLVAPSADVIAAYFEENGAAFELPETSKITYVLLTPDTLIDQVEVTDEELRTAYKARANEFQQPERRLVERLVFADSEAADRAAAALEAGGMAFETLVENRGLALADVDMGDVGRLELDAAGEAVFAAEVGAVVGPAQSPLGPALFRVNGVLPAHSVSFEDAREELQGIAASDRAARLIETLAEDFDDRLAGGATLEQLANETEMTLGQIEWTPESSEGVAAYDSFREAAAALKEQDFPRILPLEDGGVFAIRLDETLPQRPAELANVRTDVEAAWRAEQTVAQLAKQVEGIVKRLNAGESFADVEMDITVETDQTRNAFIDGTPSGFLGDVFNMKVGETRLIEGDTGVVIVRLDAISAAGDDPQAVALTEQLEAQLNGALAQDLFNIYADDVIARAGTQIDQAALNAVHVNFP